MGFYRGEYWSGLPFPSPGDLPDPGIEPRPPSLQADALPSEPPGKPNISSTTLTKVALLCKPLLVMTTKGLAEGERRNHAENHTLTT